MTKPVPDGYRSITPYMFIKGAADAIEFYKKAFGAEERLRLDRPDGKVGHAELEMGDSVIMVTFRHTSPCRGCRYNYRAGGNGGRETNKPVGR